MGFFVMLYDMQKDSFGPFALSNAQLKHNSSEAGSASVLRWWGSTNAPCLVGLGIEVKNLQNQLRAIKFVFCLVHLGIKLTKILMITRKENDNL
jgi:hypothetical protein